LTLQVDFTNDNDYFFFQLKKHHPFKQKRLTDKERVNADL